MYKKPKSQSYYEKLLETTNLNWKEIYILPRKVSIDANICMFQYKILISILFLNKLLLKLKKVPSPLCSFWNSADETLLHIFYTPYKTIMEWISIFCFSVSSYSWNHSTECPFRYFFFNIGNQQQNFFINQPFIITFQVLFVYVKRTRSCLLY